MKRCVLNKKSRKQLAHIEIIERNLFTYFVLSLLIKYMNLVVVILPAVIKFLSKNLK